eukprot:6485028-Amphidinium_carterae.1
MEGYMAVCEAFAKLRPDLEEKLEQQFEQVVQTLASTYAICHMADTAWAARFQVRANRNQSKRGS